MQAKENPLKEKKSRLQHDHVLSVLMIAVAIPLSMSFWIINILYTKMTHEESFEDVSSISPTRWLASCLIPIPISLYGYRRKTLNLSGALLALVVGFVLILANYCFLMTLLTFFLTSSKASHFRPHLKRKFEEDFKEGGERTWVQVLCNGGMATQLAILYIIDVGSSERPIDFIKDYRASWLSMGVLGVLACCNGDTWASELGTVLSHSDPYLITTFKRVPKGTNGGVSVIGTILSTVGGLVIGLAHYLSVMYFSDRILLTYAPPQWPIILYGAVGGLLGSLIDSLMGATLQYSGVDKDGKIVSHSRLSVKHISGRNILDNNSVNLMSTVIMGLLIPTLCKNVWPIS
ncbi:transmembrane protein 19 [Colias croceus]|uniref:transmembrane protein 19 n=1 Tax=Colias crocea TaxID=72248 RepID=UPI001E28083D|nr:transmembrane protein 19 [Colias croceus]XP_045498002.1 transmembrane protein 19 [Colias croceus]XP_045498003.1 transmembrane protein 19 [Colias croceus]